MPKTISKLPIFALGVDKRTESFDEKWFDETVLPTFNADKANGYKPVAHIGHTDPNGDTTERPRVAFLDNICRTGKIVFADLVDIPDVAASALEQNLFPNRSVEIRTDGKGFHSLALLGATEPHFKLDQTAFANAQFKALPDQTGATVIQFEAAEMSLGDALIVQEKKREMSDLDWALYDAMYEIRESETMSVDEKKAALNTKIEEWAALAKQMQAEIVDITDSGSTETATTEQFKAAADAQDALDKRFKAREEALLARENEILETELSASGLSPVVTQNFLALRKHLDDSTPNVRFKAGTTEEDVTPRVAYERFLKDLTRRFKAGTLMATKQPIPTGDLSDQDRKDFAAGTGETDLAAETKAIEKFQSENKIANFADARRQWLTTAEANQFRAKSA